MSELHTFNAAYAPAEDRILLQAIGSFGQHNFWITRRFLILFAASLQKMLVEHYAFTAQMASGNSENGADFALFAKDAAVTTNPPRPIQTVDTISTPPIVVHEVKYMRLNTGLFAFLLTNANGDGHGYQLKDDLLNALINLLQTKADIANWGLQLSSINKTSMLPPPGIGRTPLH